MTTTPAQIDLWRGVATENQNLELKEAKNQYDNTKLYRCCVALANEGGGHLILGVSDKPPRRICGTAAFHDPVGMAGTCHSGPEAYLSVTLLLPS